MSGREVAAANRDAARTLVDALAGAGMRHVVVSPGSRSTPLALACAHDERVVTHVVLDERSAAFFALGLAKVSGVAAALVCTSGTATTNYLPAVVEAHHSRVPLILLTADRPPELRGVGAPQTIDQTNLYGGAARLFVDLQPPDDEPPDALGAIAARCWAAAHGEPAGPVHCNAAFREPLVAADTARRATDPDRVGFGSGQLAPDATPAAPTSTTPSSKTATSEAADARSVERLGALVRGAERGLVVAGWGAGIGSGALDQLCAAAGWPLLADPISGLRSPTSVRCYDALLRDGRFADAHAPDLVLRLGGPPTSKALATWLARYDEIPHVLVARPGPVLDPDRLATDVVAGDPTAAIAAATAAVSATSRPTGDWAAAWRHADHVAALALDEALDAGACTEARVARDLVASAPHSAVFGVASSMPVRDVDAFAPARTDLTFVANRGANGIDGFTSTVLGAATATQRPAVALLGDLCFLHDTNGLLAAGEARQGATFVVVDNDGGGIFEFLPQATHVERAEFDRFFATPQGVDLVEVAQAFGVGARRCRPTELVAVTEATATRGSVEIVVVSSDRQRNVEEHRRLQAIVADALDRARSGESA